MLSPGWVGLVQPVEGLNNDKEEEGRTPSVSELLSVSCVQTETHWNFHLQ